MLNKKLLLGIVAFSLLPMFSAGASTVMDDEDDSSDMVYLRLGYNAMYVDSNTIDAAKTTKVASDSTVTVGVDDYKPKYKVNFMGGSMGIGKSFNGEARAEIEIAAQTKVEIDNASGFEYFNNDGITTNAYQNKGFNYGAVFVNAYYDVDYGKSGISPYFGGGLGVSRINFLSSPTSEANAYPIALQFKAGVSMKVNNMPPFYLGYKLVYLMQKEWTNMVSANLPAASADTVALKASYMLHNFDVGFMLAK